MKTIEIKIRGTRPMIMHNGRTSDPLDPFAKRLKQVSAKRAKTEDDYALMSQIEQEAGLYWTDELGVYLPVDNITRMFLDAAKKMKLGRQAFAIMPTAEYGVPLVFDGHDNWKRITTEERFRLRKAVTVGTAKVMRTRPLIPSGWTAAIEVELDLTLLNVDAFREICDIAGHLIGLGDWRPSAPRVPGPFGRFALTHFNGKSV